VLFGRGSVLRTYAWLRVGVFGLTLAVAGCCHRGRHGHAHREGPRADLLFGPGGETTLAVNDRTPWPETFVNNHPFEDITYREVIMNYQGRWGFDDDRPYRRFESVREGTIRR